MWTWIWNVSEALYLNDPDGNGIEIYIDRDADEWTWNEEGYVHMTTEHLNFQPILAEADGKWDGLPEGTVMGHIHLSVADLTATEKFYTDVLDYEVVTRYGAQALFISTGKYHHHIGLNTWQSNGGQAAPADAVGLKSYTVVLNDAAEMAMMELVDYNEVYTGTEKKAAKAKTTRRSSKKAVKAEEAVAPAEEVKE